MAEINVEGLTKRFGATRAVDDISLTIRPGEFLTVLGPSGSGKSTFIRLLAGLEVADSGRILINNEVVNDDRRWVPPQRRAIGMVFQSFALWPHMTVYEHVAFPLQMAGRSQKQISERVTQMIALVELDGLEEKRPGNLSGGQQQRVALARALAGEPKILLMDECLSNLDARLREKMGNEIRHIQQRLGITAIYVTHDQREALALSDRIAVLHEGKLQQVGEPDQLYNRPHNPLVAQTLGSINLLTRTEASGLGFTLPPTRALDETGGEQSDERTILGIRPEYVCVEPVRANNAPRQDPAPVCGRVTRALFTGDHSRYWVAVGATTFEAQRFHTHGTQEQPLIAGDLVCLQISPQHWIIMRSETDQVDTELINR